MPPTIVRQSPPQWSLKSSTTKWNIELTPGPYWTSFEQFRRGGQSVLDEIHSGCVGTLRSKTATFRILRDEDFQRLVGLASDVNRLKHGFTLVLQAVKVAHKHPEEDTFKLLFDSVSLLGDSPVLPERDGHGEFEIDEGDNSETDADSIKASEVPRPSLK